MSPGILSKSVSTSPEKFTNSLLQQNDKIKKTCIHEQPLTLTCYIVTTDIHSLTYAFTEYEAAFPSGRDQSWCVLEQDIVRPPANWKFKITHIENNGKIKLSGGAEIQSMSTLASLHVTYPISGNNPNWTFATGSNLLVCYLCRPSWLLK